ncbi:MAG: M14 family metallopeptidase [Clostridiales bacterium]|nr:M14 family metallopeptidase [Clostridiales bacterium]
MTKKTIYEIKSLYRDDFRVTGYEFGSGEKSACIVGGCRGNEVQQLYTCSQIIRQLKQLEKKGKLNPGHKILVIPSMNPYSMNIQKRFWPIDNSDINRMFPGYNLGETTQRIAAGIFEEIQDYKYGMQFTSFYMPGNFMPHVRMMRTGFEDVDLAKQFGFPYVVIREVRPYDTTTLNYNWQIWESKAFSVYTNSTDTIDQESAMQAVRCVLNFLGKQGILQYRSHEGYISEVVSDRAMASVRAEASGIFAGRVKVGETVSQGELLAEILDPYEGEVLEQIFSPADGTVFFAHNDPMTYSHTSIYKIVRNLEA